jgi:hypothetical protein
MGDAYAGCDWLQNTSTSVNSIIDGYICMLGLAVTFRLRDAKVIALRKPGKTAAQLEVAGGWRPIALLSTPKKRERARRQSSLTSVTPSI